MKVLPKNKITIIGAGMVGSTIAHSLIMKETAEEIALIDINESLLEAQVMDLQHAVPFTGQINVHKGNYSDCQDSAIAIISCGIAQKPGQSRLDLLFQNARIIESVGTKIFKQNPNIVIVVVSNPVDILTRLLIEKFPNKKNQIIGTGTILDSARFRHLIGKKLDINPKSIHAYILGEHGDSEFPVWSNATVGNMKINECYKISSQEKEKIFNQSKKAAYKIIAGKKATYYAIGAGTAYLIQTILYNRKTVLPISHIMEGEYGLEKVCLSLPVVVGKNGITNKICLKLSSEEESNLKKSAQILEKAYQDLKKKS